MSMSQGANPPAVVVGACAHSLAVIRSLARAGVDVHVVESDRALPGLSTRYGTKHIVDDINGRPLVSALLALAERLGSASKPVLFLTNDRMVRTVADAARELSEVFRLSFASSAEKVAAYTDKINIERRCREVGLNYPATVIVDTPGGLARIAGEIEWPRIIKPARPLSGFKVKYASSSAEAMALMAPHEADFPILLQQWIAGDDTSIYFTAFYLDRGRPLARFDGRKLRSFPMGHTTVAEPTRNDLVFGCAMQFFAGTGISGPASLEVKLDPSGRPWVIEPTVGRTDFWVDLSIANGVDLPLIEYRHQAGLRAPDCEQRDRAVWLNADRDRGCLAWYVRNIRHASRPFRWVRFTFLDASDNLPFWHALKVLASELRASVASRLHFGVARDTHT